VSGTYFDGLFPDPGTGQLSYWGGEFPEPASGSSPVVPAVGPPTVGNLALDLMSGSRVRLTWRTNIIKAHDGTERNRISNFDLPRSSYTGTAYLVGDDARATRATLARYAASGEPWLMGLPFEGATIIDDSSGTTVPVADTSTLDWAVLGQRVFVVPSDDDTDVVPGIIQDVNPGSIELDVAPGEIGRRYSTIMPAMPVLLDSQQGFTRFPNPTAPEAWPISAHGEMDGFQQDGVVARVDLATFTGGVFHDAFVTFVVAGVVGNAASLTLVGDGVIDPGTISAVGSAITYHFKPGHTTVGDMIAAIQSTMLRVGGSFPDPSTLLATPIDAFGPAALSGGVDQIWGQMGKGAALTMYGGLPVWDRGVQVGSSGSAGDLLESLTDIVELGATLFGVGTAPQSDWGRQVSITSDDPAEWQWLKLFLFTAIGQQKTWWLPTGRADLTPVSLSPGTMIVDGPSSDDGDFFAWWPSLRTRMRVKLGDGTVGYFTVTDAVDNLDGTLTLTVRSSLPAYDTGGGGPMLTDVELVSWLERCHFDSDDFEIDWSSSTFSMKTLARVVTQ
jgi:hypothetical protein